MSTYGLWMTQPFKTAFSCGSSSEQLSQATSGYLHLAAHSVCEGGWIGSLGRRWMSETVWLPTVLWQMMQVAEC